MIALIFLVFSFKFIQSSHTLNEKNQEGLPSWLMISDKAKQASALFPPYRDVVIKVRLLFSNSQAFFLEFPSCLIYNLNF